MPPRPKRSERAHEPRRRPEGTGSGRAAFLRRLPAIRRAVGERLRSLLSAETRRVARHGRATAAMVSGVAALSLRRGKRLRPALVVLGLEATNPRPNLALAFEAGAALELLHTYLLIHDDWMDDDDVRRGGPTVHVMLARRFRDERVGAASAVLAGDFALALATDVLAGLRVPDARLRAVFECFVEMQKDAVLGQVLDVTATGHGPEAAYALKTGSYSVRGPLRLGALLGGATPRALRALDRFALPLGVAFQLRDDLLGAFGDPNDTGKTCGNDLRAGKRTALVVHGLARARGRDRAELRRALGNRRASEREVRRALEILERSGAKEAVERRIDELVRRALAALDSSLDARGRELLSGAALALTNRDQ